MAHTTAEETKALNLFNDDTGKSSNGATRTALRQKAADDDHDGIEAWLRNHHIVAGISATSLAGLAVWLAKKIKL